MLTKFLRHNDHGWKKVINGEQKNQMNNRTGITSHYMIRCFLALVLTLGIFTAMSANASAQSAATKNAASRSWSAFWVKFTKAVKNKSKKQVAALASRDFTQRRDETVYQWFQHQSWRSIQNSVSKGTKRHGVSGDGLEIYRITSNNHLMFVFANGRWGFFGDEIA